MEIQTENGVLVESVHGDPGWISALMEANFSEEEWRDTHCLQYIDPYGDTTFNMLQKERLLEELTKLQDRCDEEKRKYLAPAIDLVSRYKNSVH